MTAISPTPIPTTWFPPIINAGFTATAAPFLAVELGFAPLAVVSPPVDVAAGSSVSPRLGREAVGLTIQPIGVVAGHAIGFRLLAEAEYADNAVPVGWRVAQWLFRLLKSGEIGVGVPDLVKPSRAAVLLVGSTDGP